MLLNTFTYLYLIELISFVVVWKRRWSHVGLSNNGIGVRYASKRSSKYVIKIKDIAMSTRKQDVAHFQMDDFKPNAMYCISSVVTPEIRLYSSRN